MKRKNPLLEVVDILAEPALRAEVERQRQQIADLRAALEQIAGEQVQVIGWPRYRADAVREIARAALAGPAP